ncbi:uncharacterized protein KGF55_000044 [Candida pseudojiufengensis]|uniref:uncharacterized protein n=1 Tax=Candida pseudojiufengensis TaxID=497109 RepID=UPI002224A5D6|nr:uncharacterized protein KGF55_000044 [Candida pseudojiufengensis]KAI5968060.1 hypothetical protein KGF55_000044 [Candida pseudojiufengensis]
MTRVLPRLSRSLSNSTKTIVNKKLFENAKLKSKDNRKIFGRKKTNESTTNSTQMTSSSNSSSNPYITDLPKIPTHQQSKSFEEIFKELGQYNIFLNQLKPVNKGINLIIPREFIKPDLNQQLKKQLKAEKSKDLDKKIKSFIINSQTTTEQSEKDKHLIMLGKEISSQMEPDQNEIYHTLQHPLKKSLSGLKNLNPALNNINDNYLWDFIPEDKLVCSPPYQLDDPLGFKKFNENFIIQQNKEKFEKLEILKEIKEFEKLMGNSKSFFNNNNNNNYNNNQYQYQNQNQNDQKSNEFIENHHGSRKKLNRKLLKKYKQLKDEGKIDVE